MRKPSSHCLFTLLLLVCALALAAGCAPRYGHPVAGTASDPTYSGAKNDSTEIKSVRPSAPGVYAPRYYQDETGRLYYRDREGRMVYSEESPRGRTMAPARDGRGAYAPSGRSEVFCNQQWSSCINKCNEISNVQLRLNCLDECDFRREQCSP